MTANAKLAEAEKEAEMLQQKLAEGIQREATTLKEQKEKELKAGLLGVGGVSVSLAIYCAFITLLWLSDKWAVLKTVPDWFGNRGKDIVSAWKAVQGVYISTYSLLEPLTNKFIANSITMLLFGVLIAVFGFFAFKGVLLLKTKIKAIWNDYECMKMKILVISVTAALFLISIPIAIFAVEVIGIVSINVVSLFLMSAFVLNAVFHMFLHKMYL